VVLRLFLAILATLVVAAACSASVGVGSGDIGPSTSSADDPGNPGTSNGASLPASIIDPIVADAAAGGGVDPSAVKIVTAETRTYGDSSLGCPRPGEMYTQAVVDGYQVVVEVNGTQLDYRGSGPGRFRVCENP
jgi:hypothetical protein